METALDRTELYFSSAEQLRKKILGHSAVVGVVGLGYVGLPLAVEKAKVGFKVMGIDQNCVRARMVNNGESFIADVEDKDLKQLVIRGKLRAYTDINRIQEADVIVICVPTPLTKNKQPDLSCVINVTQHVAKHLRAGQLVTLESTTYPGTTREVMVPILEKSGLSVGEDFFVAFSPERVDPGNKRFITRNTSKVVGGITPICLDLARAFYEQTILEVITVSSTDAAEMTKIFENTYRAVNIALVNEMAVLCDRMSLNIWEILDAAATKPFGIQVFYPGPGVGGHCIPVDPFYLTWKAREYDFHTRFIELAAEINMQMPYHVVNKITTALNRNGRSLKDARVILLGVTYKKDIADTRESPALKILQLLIRDGVSVQYHDAYVPELRIKVGEKQILYSSELSEDILSFSDCVVIVTDHTYIDFNWVAKYCSLIVDTRNAVKSKNTCRAEIITL